MPVKKRTLSSELHLRIKKVKTLEQIEEVYNDSTLNYKTINDVLNDAIEIGVKAIKDGNAAPENVQQIIKKEVKRCIDTQYRCTNKVMLQLRKITILESVQELILSSLVQEFELYLKAQGIKLDEKMLEDFKNSLPKRFEEDKQYFISRLLVDDNAGTEGGEEDNE